MNKKEGNSPKPNLIELHHEKYVGLLSRFLTQDLPDIIRDPQKRYGFLKAASDRDKVINFKLMALPENYAFVSAELKHEAIEPNPLSWQPSWHTFTYISLSSENQTGLMTIDEELLLVKNIIQLYIRRYLGLKSVEVRMYPDYDTNNHKYYWLQLVLAPIQK